MRSVAADAGVSEATVYAVYGTKAGLATSLVESGEMDAGVEQVAREIEAAQGDPAAQLAAFIRFDRRLFERGGDGLRLTVEGGRNEPRSRGGVRAGAGTRRREPAQGVRGVAERGAARRTHAGPSARRLRDGVLDPGVRHRDA